jgi:prolyl 4-hydroxylase
MVVSGPEYEFHPLNRLETCEVVDGIVTNFAKGSTLSCDNLKDRMNVFSHSVWHVKRIGLNYVQPQLVPPVTQDGFLHFKMPESTFAWLKSWYDAEKIAQEVLETSSGPCMNQRVSPSSITHLPQRYKDRLSNDLRSTLEGWYGGELELTSIYGVRKYTNGSVLRMHVDTINTHVVSAIINVDQELDEDWPLLILDHEDKEHEVLMKPGDMVLYESAKLLHGRPTAMVGSHYDNIFIHYKPTSNWEYGWV